MAGAVGRLRDPGGRPGATWAGERVGHVVREQGDLAAPAGGQGAGRGVGDVAQRRDGVEHPQPGGGGDAALALPLTTKETVATETPARAATSTARARRGGWSSGLPPVLVGP